MVHHIHIFTMVHNGNTMIYHGTTSYTIVWLRGKLLFLPYGTSCTTVRNMVPPI